jgi:hypothetical protein
MKISDADCVEPIGIRSVRAFLRTGEDAFVCQERGAYSSFVSVPPTGTAK